MDKTDKEKLKELLQEVSDNPELRDRYACFSRINKDAAWKRFCRKERISLLRRMEWKRLCRYAAVLTLPLIIGIGAWVKFSETTPQAEAPLAAMQPGGQQGARLTLGNGETIVLDSAASQSLAMHAVDATANSNTLVYDTTVDADQAETQPDAPQMNTLETGERGTFKVVLEDGTQIHLNNSSRLVYPAHFASNRRVVKLEGEGYFQISKDASRPFIIEMGGVQVKQLGTEFNAYFRPGKPGEVVLIEGSVQMTSASGMSALLKPGQIGRTAGAKGEIEVRKVNTALYTAWHKGVLSSDDLPMRDLIFVLSRWYGVDMEFADKQLENIVLSVRLTRHDDLSLILERLEYTQEVKFIRQDDKIVITGTD